MNKQIRFSRARSFLGVRKAPGPSGSTIWTVWSDLSVKEILRARRTGKVVGSTFLGEVYWFNRWQQYAFFPAFETVFEKGCLRTIATFCEGESKKLRERNKTTPGEVNNK